MNLFAIVNSQIYLIEEIKAGFAAAKLATKYFDFSDEMVELDLFNSRVGNWWLVPKGYDGGISELTEF